jgi:hypothetical protein
MHYTNTWLKKEQDNSSHPARFSLSRMMSLPMIHGFSPIRHLTYQEYAIHKKSGSHKSEAMRIIHIVETTENPSLKIGVAWKIKQLVKSHKGIFHEFQFGHPKSTCTSAIILKKISIEIINIRKTPTVRHDIDATKAFDFVINGISRLALRSLGFPESLTTMIGQIWSGRKCHVKTVYGVSTKSYR